MQRILAGHALSAGARTFHSTAVRMGLLKGINPVLTADLLHVLRAAGHGRTPAMIPTQFLDGVIILKALIEQGTTL